MKKYKYITIGQYGDETYNNRPIYKIVNNKSEKILGGVHYYPQWRQYVFAAYDFSMFNNSCLRDILDFMENHAGKESNGQ